MRVSDHLAAGVGALDGQHERIGAGDQRDPHDLVTLRLGREPSGDVVAVQQGIESDGPDASAVEDDERKARDSGLEPRLGAHSARIREQSIALEAAPELHGDAGGGRIVEAIEVYDAGTGGNVTELGPRGGRTVPVPGV